MKLPLGKGYMHVKETDAKETGQYWRAYHEGNNGCTNPVPVEGKQ